MSQKLLLTASLAVLTGTACAADYLPLAEGKKWTLRSNSERQAVVIEVLGKEGDGYHVRFTSPWSANDWKLTPRGQQVALTGYGTNGKLMNLPDSTIFFDFAAPAGKKWENPAGKLAVISRNLTVNSRAGSFADCIMIKQTAGKSNFAYTFAPDVGFVQFGEGKDAFTLEESPGSASSVQARRVSEAGRERSQGRSTPPAAGKAGRVLLGTTVTTFANESEAPENLLKRFNQTIDAGVGYISGAGKWTDFEPSKGKYNFESLDFQAHLAQTNNVKMSYTLRLIDTVHKAVPNDLMKKGWNDPEMESRVMRLIDNLAPLLRDRVQWFMFGNEIDGYFDTHKDEIAPFIALHGKVSRRLKELVPGIQVSATLQFKGIDTLKTSLSQLDPQLDFLSITYYPMKGDFTVEDPQAPRRDLPRMKAAAGNRQVVLQEIGYPDGAANKSNQDMQAQFFENMFAEMRANSGTFVAGSVFLLADLRDKFAKDLASYYGINNYEPFRSFLQTLGLHDGKGNPKKSWAVFQQSLKN